MFKRKQKSVSESSKTWYQDKYQRVLVQRNILALAAILALLMALLSVFAVQRLAPLKTVEPYLLQMDDKSGIVRAVDPVERNAYAASEAVDRYFLARYITARETYNFSILRSNYNLVRVMSTPDVFYQFRGIADPENPESLAARLGTTGQRDIRFVSISYLSNPPLPDGKVERTPSKIMQARLLVTEKTPDQRATTAYYVATVTFEYVALDLSAEDVLLNPLGFQVVNYQIQKEIN